ncbi:MAG TPA: AAA family ATPase, partial [Polyangiaceae bacterium]|nr:AAA family ATPase [Polyangiaceae bacterium]
HLEALRDRLSREAGEEGWSLIVIDPQARFAGVEVETNNALATRFVQECEALSTAPGNPTVLVLAHSSKFARRQGQADSRGVTALTDGFRWHATLTAAGKDRAKLAIEKNNYGRPSDPIYLVRSSAKCGLLFVETDADREKRKLDDDALAAEKATEKEARKAVKAETAETERIQRIVKALVSHQEREKPDAEPNSKALVSLAGIKTTLGLQAVAGAEARGYITSVGTESKPKWKTTKKGVEWIESTSSRA